jgi:hypothetical protein
MDKFLKFDGGGSGGGSGGGTTKKAPRRHLSSADGHARRTRMARARKANPKLVDQLVKDIRYELSVGASASGVARMRNMEQMRRMMGAMATRSFLQRAIFKRTARAFFHWLCDGVDHAHVAHLKNEIEVHKEIVEEHVTTVQRIEEAQADNNNEVTELREELKKYRTILAGGRGQVLIPILNKTRVRVLKKHLQRWHRRIFAEAHAKAQLARAASYFSNRQLRLAWDSFSAYHRGRIRLKRVLLRLGKGQIRRMQMCGLMAWHSVTVGPGSAKAAREETKRLRNQLQRVSMMYLIASLRRNHLLAQGKALAHWRSEMVIEKWHGIILSRATQKLRRKLLAQLVGRWQDAVAMEKKKQALLASVLRKTQQRLLRGRFGIGGWRQWQAYTIERDAEDEIMRIRIERVFGRLCNGKMASAWESWRLQLEASKREELVLRRAAARLQLRTARAALASWCNFVTQRHEDRMLMKRTFRVLIRQNIAAGWRQWIWFLKVHMEEARAQKERDSAMLRIFKRLDAGQLGTAWQSWVVFVKEDKHRKLLLRRAGARMKNKLAKAAWMSWTGFLKDRHYARRLAGRVFGRIVQGKLAAAFFSWSQYLKTLDEEQAAHEHQRKLMLRILSRLANAQLSKGFIIWSRAFKEARRLEVVLSRAARRLKNRALKAALDGWKASTATRQDGRRLAWKVLSRLANAKASSAFKSWLMFAQHCQRNDNIKARIAARMKNRRAVAALNTWKDSIQYLIEKRMLLRRAAAKLARRALVYTFDSWADWSEDQRQLRNRVTRIVGRMLNAYMLSGFNTWLEDVRAKRDNENGLKKAVGMFRNRKLSMSWNAWHGKVQALVRYRNITQRFLKKMSLRVEQSAFIGWLDLVDERKRNRVKVSRILGKMRLREAAAAFYAWLEFTESRQHQRRLVSRVMSRLVQSQKSAGWNTWVQATNAGRRMDHLRIKAAARWRNKLARAAFDTWGDRVREAVRLRNQLQRAIAKFKNRVANAAFLKWREMVQELVMYRVLLRRAAIRMQNKCVVAALDTWRQYVKDRREARALCRRVMSRMINTKVYAAWRTWTAMVDEYKRYITILARAKARMTNRLVTAAWSTWHYSVQEAKRNRLLLRRAAQKMRNRQMASSFETWAEHIWEERRKGNAVARGLKMWKNRLLGGSFQGWTHAVQEKVRNRTIVQRTLQKMRKRNILGAFNSWDDFTCERKRMRKVIRSVLSRLINRTLSAAWRSWLRRIEVLRWEHQLASLGDDEQKAIRDRKRWNEERARVEAMEQQRKERAMRRVIMRVQNRCLLTTLDAWVAFTAEVVREKTILKRAAAKIILRTTSSAFEGWYSAVATILTNRGKVRRVLLRMQQRITAASFDTWVETYEEQKRIKLANTAAAVSGADGVDRLSPQERQCKRVLTRMLNTLLVCALDRWKEQTAEHRRLERLLDRVMKRWKNKTMARCFDAWSDAVRELVRNRVLVSRAAAKWKLRAAAGCLWAWMDFTQEQKENRTRIARCLAKIKSRALSSAYEGWRSSFLEARRVRDLLARAAMKMKMRVAAMAFTKWYESILGARRTKHLLARAALRMKNRQVAQAYESWHALWRTRKKIKQGLRNILSRKWKHHVKIAWAHWYVQVVAYKASVGKPRFCTRCKKKLKEEQRVLALEQNWDSSPGKGIPGIHVVDAMSTLDTGASGSKSRMRPVSASGCRAPGRRTLGRKHDISVSFGGASKQITTLDDAGGSALSLVHTQAVDGSHLHAHTSALDSPSGSGLRGARGLALSHQQRSDEMATLRARIKRAAREANTLRERIQQIESQYELRLQITLQRSEERQKELSQLIKQQKTDLQTLEKQREFQTSSHANETAGLRSENNKLRLEIAEKQKALERSIAQRHTVEESLVEMSRWFRRKGKSTDQIPMNELLNRLSSTRGGSVGGSTSGRGGGSRSGSSSVFTGGSVLMQQSQHDLEIELERANLQAAQTAMDYKHVLHANETLQEALLDAKAAASESSAATLRVQAESRDAIMDIASRASKQLKHQQERCNSLEAMVQKLQAQSNEDHGSHLDAVNILEADLLVARQTVSEKELELDMYERKYSTLKAEFDEYAERRRRSSSEDLDNNTARHQMAASLVGGANAASAPRQLLPSRDAYIAWAN